MNHKLYLTYSIISGIFSIFSLLEYYRLSSPFLISLDDFKTMNKNKVVIIDVRTTVEYNMGHVKKSINIPLSTFSKSKFKKFNKNDKIVLYCNTGHRARRAADLLKSYGFLKVYYLNEGYHDIQKIM